MALFTNLHLKERHGIGSEAVVGFVNDGTDDLYMSHAWHELDGKRTEITISHPLRPEVQRARQIGRPS